MTIEQFNLNVEIINDSPNLAAVKSIFCAFFPKQISFKKIKYELTFNHLSYFFETRLPDKENDVSQFFAINDRFKNATSMTIIPSNEGNNKVCGFLIDGKYFYPLFVNTSNPKLNQEQKNLIEKYKTETEVIYLKMADTEIEEASFSNFGINKDFASKMYDQYIHSFNGTIKKIFYLTFSIAILYLIFSTLYRQPRGVYVWDYFFELVFLIPPLTIGIIERLMISLSLKTISDVNNFKLQFITYYFPLSTPQIGNHINLVKRAKFLSPAISVSPTNLNKSLLLNIDKENNVNFILDKYILKFEYTVDPKNNIFVKYTLIHNEKEYYFESDKSMNLHPSYFKSLLNNFEKATSIELVNFENNNTIGFILDQRMFYPLFVNEFDHRLKPSIKEILDKSYFFADENDNHLDSVLGESTKEFGV